MLNLLLTFVIYRCQHLRTKHSSPETLEVQNEWITFRTLLANKPGDNIALQVKELITNERLVTMFLNLHKIASSCLTKPVSTASIETSFSKTKLNKTCLQNSPSEGRLSHLMRIAIDSPENFTEDEIEATLEVWNRTLHEEYLFDTEFYKRFYLMWLYCDPFLCFWCVQVNVQHIIACGFYL